MRKWLLVVALSLLPFAANAERPIAFPQAVAPPTLAPSPLVSPIGDTIEKMQVQPPIAPPPAVPPTINVQDPVPPVPPQTVPIGGSSNEPSLCAAGTDSHDCNQGANH